MLSPANSLRVRAGTAVQFECTAEGEPEPSVRWEMPPNRDVSAGPRDNILSRKPDSAVISINSVTVADAGTYICRAYNTFGTTESRFVLEGER